MTEAASMQPKRGPMSGRNLIGEVTEAVHKFILDGWDFDERQPTIKVGELDYVPMDRNEQVIYIYMYRVTKNPNLQNQKRMRQAPVFVKDEVDSGNVYYHRPPLLLDLFYLITVHSKFQSEADRLLGWILLRLYDATHLIYRPRKFLLPDGRAVDSLGRDYVENGSLDDDDLQIEKVSMAFVEDLTVGDTVNMFSLLEAPYRPFLTYRARIALDGPLVHAPSGTMVHRDRLGSTDSRPPSPSRKNGRIPPGQQPQPKRPKRPFFRRDNESET